MESLIDNTVLVDFDEEQNLLTLYDIETDGERVPFAQISLSKLASYGLEKACYEVGANILSSLSGTRVLFKKI